MTEDEVRVALHSISTGHVGWGDGEWNDLLLHDAAQRAHIAELEARLATLQHIGTGAGQAVDRKYE